MRPGDVVDERFVIERLAGVGGMGKVYRALDRQSGQPVALKILDGAPEGPRRDRFAREARLLADLRHPGIVRYSGHGTAPDGQAYLAMEWLDGGDLRARLAEGRMSIGDAIGLTVQIAEALGAAHQKGIVHRDVKPSNIYLVPGPTARVKLLDFGVARERTAASDVTRTGARVGTPRYMAPEQVRGARDVTPRSDVFSLGCVLYECLTSRAAFGGSDEMAVLAKILLDEPQRAGELRFAVPPALDALLARMLSKDPLPRPPDGAAVAAELAALRQLSTTPQVARGRESLSRNEQRLLSVVVARLQAPPPDPTPERDVAETRDMNPELALAGPRRVAARFGGKLERLADGAVVITLAPALPGATAPTARPGGATDQAAHAARCALAVRDLDPRARIALATGRGLFAAAVPVGDVIDRGVALLRRLARGAGDGLIALDETTAGLLDARFEIEELATAAPSAPGASAEVTLTLRGERDRQGGGRRLLGRPSPRVGRERELAQLTGLLDECARDAVAHAALITAPAGMGKSRLLDEWLAELATRTQPPLVLLARGDPLHSEQRFGLLAPAVREQAGLRDDERPEAQRAKLEARVGRHLPESARGRVAAFIGELCGVPFPDDGGDDTAAQLAAARRDPVLMADQLRRAWEDFLSAECGVRPVLIALDDLQWADAVTVRLVDGALRALDELPLFVVALARPQVSERFPRLWSERRVHELPLGGLPRRAAETLVRDALGARAYPEVVRRLVERAAGNALFLEELIRAEAAGQGDQLPATVLAMVQARLEPLEAEARLVLRAAAILGERFREVDVIALLEGTLDAARVEEWLAELAERELVVPDGVSQSGIAGRHAFAHGFLRDAAYAMLTHSDRLVGHRLAGAWLEQQGDPEARVIAEHFERGAAPARAIEWYRRAGMQALGAADTTTALDCAERGVSCGASGALLGALRLLSAEALAWRGGTREASDAAHEALDLLPAGSGGWCAAAAEAASAASALGDRGRLLEVAGALQHVGASSLDAAQAASLCRVVAELYLNGLIAEADALLAVAEAKGADLAQRDPQVTAALARGRELRASCVGDMPEALSHAHIALAAFAQVGNRRYACVERMNIGYGYGQLGALDEGERLLRQSAAEAEDLGLPNIAALARGNLAMVLAERGALDEAERMARRALTAFVASSDRRLEAATRAGLGQILLASGRAGDAAAEARLAVMLASTSPPAQALALATLARALIALDRSGEAREASTRAHQLLVDLGGLDEGETLVRLAHAEALRAEGDDAAARVVIGEAQTRVLARAATIGDPVLRRAFLQHGPLVARIRELATAWQ